MSRDVVLTSERTLCPAEAKRGTEGAYYHLQYGPGEPHVLRNELAPRREHTDGARSISRFAQITDVHVVDTQSPGRFEFMQRFSGGPEVFHNVVPAYRPQEALHSHAVAQMIRTLNGVPQSSRSGAPLQFVVVSGDCIDNKQRNELQWFLSLMQGGRIDPNSGAAGYEGVQAPSWADPDYWHPDAVSDQYKVRWGFPEYPGLLEEAMHPFDAEGLSLPWLSLYGNHDALILGTAIPDPTYDALVTGSMKATGLPAHFEAGRDLMKFVWEPEILLQGPERPVAADAERRCISRRSFIEAHLDVGGTFPGHGFTAESRANGTAYYVFDAAPEVRMVMLDTTNPGGYYQGSVGQTQTEWLVQRLIEVHAAYYETDGTLVHTDHPDRLVVICSHHDSTSLTNPVAESPVPTDEDDDLPRLLGPQVESLLHRFPNVILWINGHTHRHTVRPHPGPRVPGFWEVTTGSLLDWPCQARVIEILDNSNGTLSILCSMLDHNAPPEGEAAHTSERLAAIHRNLAANDPYAGIHDPLLRGEPKHRNVELVVPRPFGLQS